MENLLSEKDLSLLRIKGLLLENEIAFLTGITVVAENVLTKERRVVETQGVILESKRTLLKG